MRLRRPQLQKSVPTTSWTAAHRWDFSVQRFALLTFGLFLFGVGDSLIIKSKLGNAPWSVLAQGMASSLAISIGTATLLVSLLVLMLWIPLRERPGLGTVTNILVIPIGIDLGLRIFPEQSLLIARAGYVFLGIALIGLGSALYITCGLGPGPRDGWMTALNKRTGISVAKVRITIELSVLTLGWFLGGIVGIGTVLFATLIGYSVAIFFGVVARATSQ